MKGFITNIEKDTLTNEYFRKVLYTTKNTQLVLMTLEVGEDIGEEIHAEHDQFIRIEAGSGMAILDGVETPISDGSAIVIPAGTRHNIINTSKEKMRLYTLYSPPEHKDKTIHKTKEEALQNKEHFDGETSE